MNYTHVLEILTEWPDEDDDHPPAVIGCTSYEEALEIAERVRNHPRRRGHIIAKLERPEAFPGLFGSEAS